MAALPCAGAYHPSELHPVPAFRAAAKQGCHPPPAALPESPDPEHFHAQQHLRGQPSPVWPGSRRLQGQPQVRPPSCAIAPDPADVRSSGVVGNICCTMHVGADLSNTSGFSIHCFSTPCLTAHQYFGQCHCDRKPALFWLDSWPL